MLLVSVRNVYVGFLWNIGDGLYLVCNGGTKDCTVTIMLDSFLSS